MCSKEAFWVFEGNFQGVSWKIEVCFHGLSLLDIVKNDLVLKMYHVDLLFEDILGKNQGVMFKDVNMKPFLR